MTGEAKAPGAVGAGDFDEQLGRAELSEPESDVRRRRMLAMLEIVGLHESPDHRPVLVALRLLGLDEVGQRHEIAREPVGQGDGRAASPQGRERRHAAHAGHDVDAHVKGVRMPAAEVHGVAPPQMLEPEGRDGKTPAFCSVMARPRQERLRASARMTRSVSRLNSAAP